MTASPVMRQLDLYDEPALSRRTDKPTSHEAGDGVRHKLSDTHQKVLLVLNWQSLTAREIARGCVVGFGGDSETYRKRMKEMVRDGLIEELPPRECSVTGKNATVYRRKGE